jgi:hypothetical protein
MTTSESTGSVKDCGISSNPTPQVVVFDAHRSFEPHEKQETPP